MLLHMGFSWKCWMWLVAVLWYYVVGCELAARAATFTVLTPYNVTPQHRNQPHPTLPAKNPYAVTRGLVGILSSRFAHDARSQEYKYLKIFMCDMRLNMCPENMHVPYKIL